MTLHYKMQSPSGDLVLVLSKYVDNDDAVAARPHTETPSQIHYSDESPHSAQANHQARLADALFLAEGNGIPKTRRATRRKTHTETRRTFIQRQHTQRRGRQQGSNESPVDFQCPRGILFSQ